MITQDKSKYLRGLLILLKKGNSISEEEREFIREVGNILNFDRTFVDLSIVNVFENEYLLESPPQFNDKNLAEYFIKDGIKLSVTNHNTNKKEVEFLKKTAQVNHVPAAMFKKYLDTINHIKDFNKLLKDLELSNYLKSQKNFSRNNFITKTDS